MKKWVPLLLLAISPAAFATLPPLSPDAKAKAEEAAARTAWSNKVAIFKLCESQNAVAARYFAAAQAADREVNPPMPTPACEDPGPFAFTPPGEKPLETSGAHSPSGTAATPPSTDDPAAEESPPENAPETGTPPMDKPADKPAEPAKQ